MDNIETYQVSILDAGTGERRMIAVRSDDPDMLAWDWRSGTRACDCARSALFHGSGGGACGSKNYIAEYAIAPDGRRIDLDGECGEA